MHLSQYVAEKIGKKAVCERILKKTGDIGDKS